VGDGYDHKGYDAEGYDRDDLHHQTGTLHDPDDFDRAREGHVPPSGRLV